MIEKVILYRFPRERFFVCDMKNKIRFSSKLASYNPEIFFYVMSIWYEVPRKNITTTPDVYFKANSHNTV